MTEGRLRRREVLLSGGLAVAAVAATANGAMAAQPGVRPGGERGTAGVGRSGAGMKVFVGWDGRPREWDGRLRVRIGHVDLGSASLGPWYGGTGAIRLRHDYGTRFWAYRLDDHAYRGTTDLPETELWRVREHLPSVRAADWAGGTRVDVSEADLAALRGKVVPLRTRVARFGEGMAALCGDFPMASKDMFSLGLFHLGGHRFNGFRTGFHHTALRDGDILRTAARLPSARLLRDGPKTVVEVNDADLALLLGAAEEMPLHVSG